MTSRARPGPCAAAAPHNRPTNSNAGNSPFETLFITSNLLPFGLTAGDEIKLRRGRGSFPFLLRLAQTCYRLSGARHHQAVRLRRRARQAAEESCEVALVAEARAQADLRERQAALREQRLGALDA